jgi:hypothetical protein
MLEGFFERELETHRVRPRRWVPRRFRTRAYDRGRADVIARLDQWLCDQGYEW